MELGFKYNDGGRSKYFKGRTGDCVTRAIAIATGKDYKEVYNTIKELIGRSPRNGTYKEETRYVMEYYGFTWVSCMHGRGCECHLRKDELPDGRIVCNVTHHLTAVIDGVINDTHNPSRNGTRCVYGYWYIDEDK